MRFEFAVVLALVTVATAGLAPGGPRAIAADGKDAESLSEEEKIKSLIATVRGLKDATFIRNGDEHDCDSAADHMQRKWKAGRKEIKTARDFVRLAASKSSRSGEAYRIRFKDGKEVTSEAFLTKELDKLERKSDEKDES